MNSAKEVSLAEVAELARARLAARQSETTGRDMLHELRGLLAHPHIRLDRHSYVEAMREGILPPDRLRGPRLSPQEERDLCGMLRDLARAGLFWDYDAQRFTEAPRTALEIARVGDAFGEAAHPHAIRAAHAAIDWSAERPKPRTSATGMSSMAEEIPF